MKIEKAPRKFLSNDLEIDSFEKIKPYFDNLLNRSISSKGEFEKWLEDRSELDAVLEEDLAWRYIRMTIDTKNEEHSNSYTFFVTKIQPELAPLDDQLNRKLMQSPIVKDYVNDDAFRIYFRSVGTQLNLFREENIPIEAFLNEKSQEFGAISGAQTIEHEGQEITMQKAAQFLKEQDENLRKTIFDKISIRRRKDIDALNNLYSELIVKRHELAVNAGFENFRDYKFQSLGRFDYTK
jgi:oligoendopeptidase F